MLDNPLLKQELKKNVEKIKKLVNVVLTHIFENLDNLPPGIRIVCKIIELLVLRKFPSIDKRDLYNIISNFLFLNWMFLSF